MLLLALAFGHAAAGPVLVRVSAPRPPLEPPVALHEATASWRLRDDGSAPDPQVGDGVWTGVAAATPGASAALRLTDGTGREWAGSLSWPSGGTAELDLVLADDGVLGVAEAPIQVGATPTTAPVGTATVPRTVSGSWAWAVAALGWGLALSAALRRIRRAPRALSPLSSPLGARRFTVPVGEGAAACGSCIYTKWQALRQANMANAKTTAIIKLQKLVTPLVDLTSHASPDSQ